MKYEWRKKDKALYLPTKEPMIIDIPPMQYLVITGEGNPNGQGFSECVQSLYAMSYGIRMLPKTGVIPVGYYEYTVFPLEGIWSFSEEGINRLQVGEDLINLKDYMTYKLMIRQPDFVDWDLVEKIRVSVATKKKSLPIDRVTFETISEGNAVQMLHIGSYDSEPESFARMEAFASEQGLERKGKHHKEIYLSDPNKVAPEKQKTTLRFWVR